jgi:ribosomal protein S12 methylthiotransferase accessory factor YcaO
MKENQIAVIRTIWELAQGRIDQLYSKQGAEEEKRAIEKWITEQFPLEYDSIIRSESLHYKGD